MDVQSFGRDSPDDNRAACYDAQPERSSTRRQRMKRALTVLTLVSSTVLTAADDNEILPPVPAGAQAVSLFGNPLMPSTPNETTLEKYETAKANYDTNPDDVDNIIWYGRRTAYKGDYREAIRIYSEGIEKFPEEARLYRHRGHRYISIRELDRAIADLEHAAALIEGTEDVVEPDGLPNANNIPIGTLHSNIWYHLGLAYYLDNDLDNASRIYRKANEDARNDDKVASTSHWLYMTLRLLGRDAEAEEVLEPIHADMNIIENFVYHQLCLFYKGELTEDVLTDGNHASNDAMEYGIGNWYFYNGQPEKARENFERLLEGEGWASFGHIAAEADLHRVGS